jgi:tetratricopeptide (TPR) repeat protein
LNARITAAVVVILGACLFGGAGAQQPPSPEADSLMQRIAALQQAGSGALELGVAWRDLALRYQGEGQLAEALEAAREALLHLHGAGEPAELAEGLNRLGVIHWSLARYDSAVVNLQRAQQIGVVVGDQAFLGRVHNNLGAAHYQWGNYELAMESFLTALHLRREVGDDAGVARVLANVGLTYQDWARFDEAGAALEEAVEIADRVGDASMQGYTRLNLGTLYLQSGDLDRAEATLTASLDYYPEAGRAASLMALARVAILRGEPEAALPDLLGVLERARAMEQPRGAATALLALAEAYRAMGELDLAVRTVEEGLAVARAWEQRPLALEMLQQLSGIQEARGQTGAALSALRSYHALRDSIFDQSTGQRIAAMEARADAERQERENLRLLEAQLSQAGLIRRQRVVGVVGGGLLLLTSVLALVFVVFNRRSRRRELLLAESNDELQRALNEVRRLEGLIPICSHCKKVRDDSGYWQAVESYVSARSEALFSHSICTECGPRVFGADWSTEPEPAGREG